MQVLNRLMALVFMTSSLVACSFGRDDNAALTQEIQNRVRQENTYGPILGRYRGQLTQGTRAQEIELELYTLEQREGTNADGTDRFRTVLRAAYKKITPAGAGYVMEARYSPEVGSLILTNTEVSRGTLGLDDVHTITSRITQGFITGDAKSPAGILGNINLELVTQTQDGPVRSPQEDYYERLKTTLQSVAGTYQGIVRPPPQQQAPFRITVKLYVIDTIANGNPIPTLVGVLSRDADTSRETDLALTVTYKADLDPKQIVIIGRPQFGNSTYTATLNGRMVGEDIQASFQSSAFGDEGPVTLKRVAK